MWFYIVLTLASFMINLYLCSKLNEITNNNRKYYDSLHYSINKYIDEENMAKEHYIKLQKEIMHLSNSLAELKANVKTQTMSGN